MDLFFNNDVDAEDVEDADVDAEDVGMATPFGNRPGTMSSFYKYILQHVLDGEIDGGGYEFEEDDDLDDDKKALSRVDERFTIPENFSTEKLQNNCSYCGKKHARNVCCKGHRGEKHSGVLEFMSWEFDPLLAARTKQMNGNASSLC